MCFKDNNSFFCLKANYITGFKKIGKTFELKQKYNTLTICKTTYTYFLHIPLIERLKIITKWNVFSVSNRKLIRATKQRAPPFGRYVFAARRV